MTGRPARPSPATPYSAPALDKGLDIIELLCRTDTPLSQRDLAAQLGRSVGEIYRMLACLVRRGYVGLVDDNYILTTRLFELAHDNPPTHRLLVEAQPVMEGLASALDQSCHLTVWASGRQVVVAKVDTPSGMGFSVRVGSKLDVAVSASGRVLLAFQSDAVQALRLREAEAVASAGLSVALPAALAAIRRRGYESARSVQVHGLHAVSFPILNGEGHAIAALTVPFTRRIDQPDAGSLAQAKAALGAAARTLGVRIGGGGAPPA